jgi:hypothetical protein
LADGVLKKLQLHRARGGVKLPVEQALTDDFRLTRIRHA